MGCWKKFLLSWSVVLILVVSTIAAERITLWTWYGTEMGAILKDMIQNEFSAKTGIEVDIVVLPAGDTTNKLILSYIGGDAPDVVELYSNQVVELGVRDVLLNLNSFPDITKVTGQMNPMLLPTMTYRKNLYGIPSQVNWAWTYYRTDILNELGLSVPETWDDLRSISQKLKARNMDTYYAYNGVNPEVGKLLPFVFQRNTDIYNEDGTASTLDSPECIAAFKELTDLHIKYKFPIEDPTYTTFADGRTPIQIAQNWYYPGFEQTSPQLKGKWDLALFPGIKQKDGTINRTNTGKSLVWSIVSTTKKKEAAWKLIQYLSSDEFTQRFANSVYDRLKVRLFYSNDKYLAKAPFPQEQIPVAKEALATCRMQTAVVGGNVADRYIAFAFNKVVLQNADPEEAIKQAAKESTMEIQKKLKEFSRYIKNL